MSWENHHLKKFLYLLKYLPFLLVLPYFYYPSKSDLLPFIGPLVIVISMLFFYFKTNLFFFKIYVLTVLIINVVLIFLLNDYMVFLDIGLTFFAEILQFLVLAFDIFILKAYKNWYFLESFKNEIDIKFSQKRDMYIKFFRKNLNDGFWSNTKNSRNKK